MAHVFKPVYTKPIPKNAERVKNKDGPAVRWKGRGGKWVTGLVCEDKPDRCRVESATWYIEYTDHDGRPQRKKGYTDKGATEALMAELVRQAARISSGLLPPEAALPRRSLSEQIERWHDYIIAGGAQKASAAAARNRCRDVCEAVEAVRPSDLNPTEVQGWLAERRAANRHRQARFGAVTSDMYLGAVKAFTRWLAVVDKSEPVDHLSAVRRRRRTDDSDARRPRRALQPDEIELLIATACKSTEVLWGLTGPERAVLYLTASTTGLRAKELSSLTSESIDLDRGSLKIHGRRAKNKRTDTLPLADDVAAELRAMLSGRGQGPIWPHREPQYPTKAWWKHGAKMVAADLAAAKIPLHLDGQVFDFHCLRGQFATDLDRSGVNMIRAQRLMRLSSPTLLTKHYAKPDQEAMAEDVNRLRKGRTGGKKRRR